ncbi:ATP-dependent DNA helicase RecG, partial [Mycobacterium sp. ITM-2017-0098]
SRIDEDDQPSDGDTKAAGKAKKAKKETFEQGPPPVTVVDLFAGLQRGPLAGMRLGLMHGRLSGDEKDAVMRAFRAGEIDVLICTT